MGLGQVNKVMQSSIKFCDEITERLFYLFENREKQH